jgi:hypothetical protein
MKADGKVWGGTIGNYEYKSSLMTSPFRSLRTGTKIRWLRRLAPMLLSIAVIGMPFATAAGAEESPFVERVEPILFDYCYDCHGDGMRRGNLAFDGYQSESELVADHDLWLAVLKNVRAGVMPPRNRPQPNAEELAALEDWIKGEAFGIDVENPDPGRVTIRRLNRIEYRNTIRDLMGIDYNTLEEFPPDDTGYGFDTVGDALMVSPMLLEKYMQAAESIVTEAVPTAARVVPTQTVGGNRFRSSDGPARGDRLTFYEPAAVAHRVEVEQDGMYRMIVNLDVSGHFDFDPGRALVVFRVNGEERVREEMGWHNHKRFRFEFEEHWKAGSQQMELELAPLVSEQEKRTHLDLRLASVRVEGPLEREHWIPTQNYDRFFFKGEPTESEIERQAYARELLERFASRAFRRPVDARTLDRLTAFAEAIYSEPGISFEAGVSQAMVAVLASPRFLFRIEEAAPDHPDDPYPPLDEYSLASRLSYFLWSSMPDEELFELAARGELRDNLGAQVNRLLGDSRSEALIENFAGQWLQARDVEGVSINARAVLRREGITRRFDFDRSLRLAMRRETELYFGHVLRENRSIVELLDSDYTFLNQQLAEFYGIPGVEGRELRLVTLPPGSPRGGVLTQGTLLTVTSNPTRTSPVKRGMFILENILGTPPPPAPPDIPELEEAEQEFKDREPTMREMMQAHRENPLCHSCHARMDPLGLAFENFNALGQWRETERRQPIDTAGELITGEAFQGIQDLKRILAEDRRLDFYHCLTEKLLTYALGRGLEYHDVHAVDQIVAGLVAESGRSSALLMGVIESAPFQHRRKHVEQVTSKSSQKEPQLVQATALP